MRFSLRQLARSRRLRAMSVLAWLMLVIQSVAAAPMSMPMASHAQAEHPMVAAAAAHAAHGMHCHHAATSTATDSCCHHSADCCNGAVGQCACAAMCATALLSRAALMPASMALTATYAMPSGMTAPSGTNEPPLRPPAV